MPVKKVAIKKSPARSGKKLDAKKLGQYKKLLLQMRENILSDIKNMRGESGDFDSKDVSGHVIHMADVATDMYDKEFNMGLASKDRVLLQKIEDALRRIEDGTYGFCLATGKTISPARLKAIPYAEYCLEYQEELEKKK
jgi:DnaK suppressor protein